MVQRLLKGEILLQFYKLDFMERNKLLSDVRIGKWTAL